MIPFEHRFLSEILVEHRVQPSFLEAKYHLTPSNQETTTGPL